MERRLLFMIVIFILYHSSLCLNETRDRYIKDRNKFIVEEKQSMVGADLMLNENETKVNEYLVKLKSSEIRNAKDNGSIFPPAIHFFYARSAIERSPVFKIISDMPKGNVRSII